MVVVVVVVVGATAKEEEEEEEEEEVVVVAVVLEDDGGVTFKVNDTEEEVAVVAECDGKTNKEVVMALADGDVKRRVEAEELVAADDCRSG